MTRLDSAIKYIRGYCRKHTNCGCCELSDFDGACILKNKIPADFRTQEEYFAYLRKKYNIGHREPENY